MAVVTKGDEGKRAMADDIELDRPEPPEYRAPSTPASGGGFFHVYKPGQGYWTRLGTSIGAAVLILAIARFIYQALTTRTQIDWVRSASGVLVPGFPTIKLIIAAVFVVVSAALTWYYINKPTVVDFFIATESEMKKVNWTSRKELVGSTKVVIGFMFITAALLFLIDVFFGYLFHFIRVLNYGPFGG